MTWRRRLAYGLLALVALAAGAFWWLLIESHRASPAAYPLDLATVRRLAGGRDGLARQVRVETIGHLAAPRTFVVAGDGFATIDLPVVAYQLDYGSSTAIVDTGFDPATAREMSATGFDRGAFARVSAALDRAALIVVTHEHPDHVAGLLTQPQVKRLLGRARLTLDQVRVVLKNRQNDAFSALHLPADLFSPYRPLGSTPYQRVAPGVVLIRAPGHTPGSQMVYVRRADGVEYLLIGDIAWTMRGIEAQREKARLVSWLSEEDRAAVRAELAALHQLHVAHPEIHMIAGHDAAGLAATIGQGLLVRGFR